MSLDVDALQARLRAFAAERQWQPFHTPKNLAMALMQLADHAGVDVAAAVENKLRKNALKYPVPGAEAGI